MLVIDKKSSDKDSKNVDRASSFMIVTYINYMNRNVLVVLIVFIDIVADTFNFNFRFRGNDARLIEGAVLLGLLVSLHHLTCIPNANQANATSPSSIHRLYDE